MDEVEGLTEHNTGTTVTVAVDYGGRWDITEAAVALGRQVEAGQISRPILMLNRFVHRPVWGVFPIRICVSGPGREKNQ